jgi:hypothetical protein
MASIPEGGAVSGAGAGTGGGPPAPASGDRVLLTHDPSPFECPYSACEYDCQKRAPVRAACACKRLVCRKCAEVAAGQPGGCGLCGAAAQEGHATPTWQLDIGVLLARASALAPATER